MWDVHAYFQGLYKTPPSLCNHLLHDKPTYLLTCLYSIPRWSSTYIHTLFSIVKEDLTKFFVVFLVYLMGFAGAFLLAIQVYRDNIAAVQEAGGTVGGGADNTTV